MRSDANQAENAFRLGVDQHQIRLQVTVAMVVPGAAESVILISRCHGLIQDEHFDCSA